MRFFTVQQLSELFGHSGPEPVLALIKNGHLKAVNVSSNPAGRAVWRISETDLNEFIAARRTTQTPAPTARRTRKAATAPIPQYV